MSCVYKCMASVTVYKCMDLVTVYKCMALVILTFPLSEHT